MGKLSTTPMALVRGSAWLHGLDRFVERVSHIVDRHAAKPAPPKRSPRKRPLARTA
jgi:hypothetical protein